MNALHK